MNNKVGYTTNTPLFGKEHVCSYCRGDGTTLRMIDCECTYSEYEMAVCPICDGYGRIIVVGCDHSKRILALPCIKSYKG